MMRYESGLHLHGNYLLANLSTDVRKPEKGHLSRPAEPTGAFDLNPRLHNYLICVPHTPHATICYNIPPKPYPNYSRSHINIRSAFSGVAELKAQHLGFPEPSTLNPENGTCDQGDCWDVSIPLPGLSRVYMMHGAYCSGFKVSSG